jgi:hypothetical protein
MMCGTVFMVIAKQTTRRLIMTFMVAGSVPVALSKCNVFGDDADVTNE